MSLPYAPSGTSNTTGRTTFSGYTYNDPGSQAYASQNADRVDAKYFLEPVQSNLLAIWQAGGGLAGYQYSNVTFTCLAGLNVGDPVRISAANTVVLATADTAANAEVIGLVAEKPTTTTCLLSHFYKGSSVGLTAGEVIYLTDLGGFSETPGTVETPLGKSLDATTYWVSALPQGAISGYSGFSGTSGWSGESGTSGTSAFSGDSGTSGYSGESGSSGTSGFSGTYSGHSGHSGTSGFSGTFSGHSGYSGFSGYSGVSPSLTYLAMGNAIKTSNEARTSTTLANDADLQLTLGAAKRYKIKALLNTLNSSTNTQTLKFKLTYGGTTSASQIMSAHIETNQTSYGYVGGMHGGGPVSIGTQWIQNSPLTVYGTILISGFVVTTTAGTLTLQWASNNGSSQTIYQGSNLEVMEAGSGAVSGQSGAVGSSGTSGYSGYSGFSGAFSGTSGFSGESGLLGESGTSGFSGLGVQGDSGASGTSGYSGYSGVSGLGVSGKSGTSGHSGQEGASGFSGAAASGYSGTGGDSGSSGTSGYSGRSGYSGYSGSVGASGASGAQGSSGFEGASGTSGYSGPVGSQGTSGFSGESGASGKSGTSGHSGTSGTSAWSGSSGFSGLSGLSGSSGTSGFSGQFSGESGFSGVGLSGTSGYSGASGAWGGTDTIQYVLDGGEYPISNGIKGTLWFDYGFVIQDWIVLADQDGDIELDVWKSTYASFPPNATNSIVGTNNPAIVNAQKGRALNMMGWTTTVTAGSALTFYVIECSAITRATLVLKIMRT